MGPAYNGKQPYIFFSYAHKDTDTVAEILESLSLKGYRVWYDEGIVPGSEWPEDIAMHLANSSMVIAFISPHAMSSENCRREIFFALARKKPFLAVFLEKTEMSLGMEMQLSAQQCIQRYNFTNWENFIDKITKCPGLEPCRDKDVRSQGMDNPDSKQQALTDDEKREKINQILEEANTYYIQENYEKNLSILLSGLEIDPDNIALLLKAGRACRLLGQYDKAMEYYEQVRHLSPDEPSLYTNIAVVYTDRKMYAEAKSYLEQAISLAQIYPSKLSPYDFATMYANYGYCLGLLGQIMQAKKNLKIAKEKGYKQSSLDILCQRIGIDPASIDQLDLL